MKKKLLTIFSLFIINTVTNAQCPVAVVPIQNCSYDPINAFSMNGVASVGNNNSWGHAMPMVTIRLRIL